MSDPHYDIPAGEFTLRERARTRLRIEELNGALADLGSVPFGGGGSTEIAAHFRAELTRTEEFLAWLEEQHFGLEEGGPTPGDDLI